MKAVQVTGFGDPTVLSLVNLPDPTPGPGQVAIDVSHAAVGLVDLFFRQGAVDLVHSVTGGNPWDPSVRILTELPARTDPIEVAAIVIVTMLLIFLATLFPALKGASTDPVQVLRYE